MSFLSFLPLLLSLYLRLLRKLVSSSSWCGDLADVTRVCPSKCVTSACVMFTKPGYAGELFSPPLVQVKCQPWTSALSDPPRHCSPERCCVSLKTKYNLHVGFPLVCHITLLHQPFAEHDKENIKLLMKYLYGNHKHFTIDPYLFHNLA